MAISRKPRAPAQREPSILDHLAARDFGDRGQDTNDDNKTPSVDTAKLLEQVSAMQSRLDELNRTNLALMSQPPQYQAPRVEPPKALDMANLPDPTLEPEAYAREVAKRTSDFITATQTASQSAASASQDRDRRAAGLWDEFSERYEDYAENQDRVEFATSKVLEKAKARGVDIEKYMFTSRDQFMKDVVGYIDNTFGKPGDDNQNNNQTGSSGNQEDPEPTRTAGLFGGLDSGGSRSQAPKPVDGDMLKDIQDIQRKGGFF